MKRALTSGRILGNPFNHAFERDRSLADVHREREHAALLRHHASLCTDPQAHTHDNLKQFRRGQIDLTALTISALDADGRADFDAETWLAEQGEPVCVRRVG